MPLFNEGDRFNGKPHSEIVNNPAHAARLRCPKCGKPAFMFKDEKACFWCKFEAEDRGDIEDNSPARLRPEQF